VSKAIAMTQLYCSLVNVTVTVSSIASLSFYQALNLISQL